MGGSITNQPKRGVCAKLYREMNDAKLGLPITQKPLPKSVTDKRIAREVERKFRQIEKENES